MFIAVWLVQAIIQINQTRFELQEDISSPYILSFYFYDIWRTEFLSLIFAMTLPVFLDRIQTTRKVCARSQKYVYEFISIEIKKKIVGKMVINKGNCCKELKELTGWETDRDEVTPLAMPGQN